MEFLIPSRRTRPGDDSIFALSAEARARLLGGENVVDATLGALADDEGKLAILGSVAQTLRDVEPHVSAGYAPIAGLRAFRRAVIDDLLGSRPESEMATSVATPGGTGALRIAIANFLEPRQTLLTSSYYWGPYKTLADDSERALATFEMFDERGRLDTADFERKLAKLLDAQGRALVFFNSPCHNPTGYSFDDDEWNVIVGVVEREAKRAPIALLFDIAYARYGARGMDGLLNRVLPLSDKAMLLFAWSASKSFMQYGMRVGALIAVHPDPQERQRVENAMVYSCRGTWSNCNAGGMAAITRILQTPELRARVDAERAVFSALLDRRVARWNELAGASGLHYPRYDGGFFTTVFCNNAAEAANRMKSEGVFVVPQAGSLRVALCAVAERDIERMVTTMAKHVRR